MYGFIGGGGDPYATPYTGGNGVGVGVGCPCPWSPVLLPLDGGAQCSGVDGVVGPDGEDGVPGCVCDGGVVDGVPDEWGGSA